MLGKADEALTKLPLFLSNEYGVLKSNRLLYFEVYRSFKPYYNFGKWIHTGDNIKSDQSMARAMGIRTRLVKRPEHTDIETELIKEFGNYNSYLTAALQANMRFNHSGPYADFVIDFIAPFMTAYVDWALRDALDRGFETLYFVSRDGHPLKLIADALISQHNWPLKTKYIYASRRTWRIPSYITEIDSDFWSNYGGNFNDIRSKEKFLHAASIPDEKKFSEIFPEIDLDSIDFSDWTDGQPARKLAPVMKKNEAYHKYLLDFAAEARKLACGYLKQEIDANEKHAFVEFYGRGYNQTCHGRLWDYVMGEEQTLYYYYARTTQFSSGNNIRYNMTTNNIDLYFVEAVFANMPYRSIEEYEIKDGKIVPVIEPASYNEQLYKTMEALLPLYAAGYAALPLHDPIWNDRKLFDYYLYYFQDHKTDPFIYNNFGSLVDAVGIYGEKKEFAPPFTEEKLEDFRNGVPRVKTTMSIQMSYMRSPEKIKQKYDELYQNEDGADVNGSRPLQPEEIIENKQSEELLDKKLSDAIEFEQLYMQKVAAEKVEDRITLITVNRKPGDNLHSLIKQLDKQPSGKVSVINCNDLSAEQMDRTASLLARSRYIVTEGNITLVSQVRFRLETTFLLLNSSAFELFRHGYNADTKLLWKKKYRDLQYTGHYTMMERPAEGQEENLAKSYYLDKDCITWINGCSVTDVYFDDEFRNKAVSKVRKLFPNAGSKKIILFVPGVRTNICCDNWLELLDMERLAELLGDQYIAALSIRGGKSGIRYYNPTAVNGFSKVITHEATLRELIVAADYIVGDYRDVMFECALLNKKVFFTGYDYEKRMMDKNCIYDFGEINPYPVINSEEELADWLLGKKDYDFSRVNAFKERYLTYCDGHSGERIAEYMLSSLYDPATI